MLTDDVHRRDCAGTGPVILKAVPVTSDATFADYPGPIDVHLVFPHTHYWHEVGMLKLPEAV